MYRDSSGGKNYVALGGSESLHPAFIYANTSASGKWGADFEGIHSGPDSDIASVPSWRRLSLPAPSIKRTCYSVESSDTVSSSAMYSTTASLQPSICVHSP